MLAAQKWFLAKQHRNSYAFEKKSNKKFFSGEENGPNIQSFPVFSAKENSDTF